jgi:hypothetical protein
MHQTPAIGARDLRRAQRAIDTQVRDERVGEGGRQQPRQQRRHRCSRTAVDQAEQLRVDSVEG